MSSRIRLALALAAASALAACSAPPAQPDAASDVAADIARDASVDTASPTDDALDAAALVDAVDTVDVFDALVAVDAADSAPLGDGGMRAILGDLSGACGTLAAMLHSPTPSLQDNVLVFRMGETYDRAALSPGGQRLFDTANAGGSSVESEVMSFEVLHYCEGADLVATETEIHYAPPDDSGANSITDILVAIGGERVGVSVTRAYRPAPMVLSDADVRDLLVRKLEGINRSSMRVLASDRWVKQILHVFAADMAGAMAIARIWPTLDAATRADTIVLVTITAGGGFIYCNPDPPLGAECPPLPG